MLRISLLEFFVRGIPEAFLFVLAGYIFTRKKINKNRYLLSSILFAVTVYGIRFLPIQYGVNTILSLILLIIILVFVNKIDTVKAIQSGIIAVILEFACEGINVFILKYVLNKDMNSLLNDHMLKTLYGIPSSLVFACIILLCYFLFSKRKGLKIT